MYVVDSDVFAFGRMGKVVVKPSRLDVVAFDVFAHVVWFGTHKAANRSNLTKAVTSNFID